VKLISCKSLRILLMSDSPTAEIPIPMSLICKLHLSLLTDSSPKLVTGKVSIRKLDAVTDCLHCSIRSCCITCMIASLSLIEKDLGISKDHKRLYATAICDYVMSLVHHLAEIVSCGSTSLWFTIKIPLTPAVCATYVRLD
jgi:hypothetical protein